MAMLAGILARRGLTGADADAYVFASPDGEPLEYSNFRYRLWLPACGAPASPVCSSTTSAEPTPPASSPRAWTSRRRRAGSATPTLVRTGSPMSIGRFFSRSLSR